VLIDDPEKDDLLRESKATHATASPIILTIVSSTFCATLAICQTHNFLHGIDTVEIDNIVGSKMFGQI
jgi:hypothetical protein